jgi:4'-phosphopantetheinyl transferase
MPERWEMPPEGPLDGEIHIWSARLGQLAGLRDTFAASLSPDEHHRAARFVFPEPGDRFMLGRGWVRSILSSYLAVEARDVVFQYGLQGKPYLAVPFAASGLRFSVSHSAQLLLVAVGRGAEVGVDLEWARPLPEMGSMAARYFTPGECTWLSRLPPARRRESFFLLWVCKEAVLKADGAGLTVPLDAIETMPRATGWVELMRADDRRSDGGRWSCRTLIPETGYVAAVAASCYPVRLLVMGWPDRDLPERDATSMARAHATAGSSPDQGNLP